MTDEPQDGEVLPPRRPIGVNVFDRPIPIRDGETITIFIPREGPPEVTRTIEGEAVEIAGALPAPERGDVDG